MDLVTWEGVQQKSYLKFPEQNFEDRYFFPLSNLQGPCLQAVKILIAGGAPISKDLVYLDSVICRSPPPHVPITIPLFSVEVLAMLEGVEKQGQILLGYPAART